MLPGILGGLGPLAHIEFERKLIEKNAYRGAHQDQDHPAWILISATPTPDRTKSLAGEAEDCTAWLLKYGQILELAGADFLIVTCNTAHAFYEQVQSQLRIPWIHLMESTSDFIFKNYPGSRKVGILASNGTLQAGLYEKSLRQAGLTPISLEVGSRLQEAIMQAIYHPDWGIKATGVWISPAAIAALKAGIDALADQGAELVIAGCTELSVGCAHLRRASLPVIDPLEVMAAITLDLAFGHRYLEPLNQCPCLRSA